MLFGRKFRSLKIRLQLKICVIISVPVLVTFLVVKIGTLIQLNGEMITTRPARLQLPDKEKRA